MLLGFVTPATAVVGGLFVVSEILAFLNCTPANSISHFFYLFAKHMATKNSVSQVTVMQTLAEALVDNMNDHYKFESHKELLPDIVIETNLPDPNQYVEDTVDAWMDKNKIVDQLFIHTIKTMAKSSVTEARATQKPVLIQVEGDDSLARITTFAN